MTLFRGITLIGIANSLFFLYIFKLKTDTHFPLCDSCSSSLIFVLVTTGPIRGLCSHLISG